MMIILLFWLLMFTCCFYAAAAGGRDGKWATAIIILASILTVPATFLAQWGRTQTPVMVVDMSVLAAMYILTLKSRAYWPIWMTAFQLVSVTTHFATLVSPSFTPLIYQGMESMWAIPGLLSMVIGISLDRGQMQPDPEPERRMPG